VLRQPSKKQLQAEQDLLKTRAKAAMAADDGFYNVHPWRFVPGVGIALAAIAFTVYCIQREHTKEETPKAQISGEIWVDLE
jgi:hypothetical protein